MPHAFAALHETEVPYQAIPPATHSGYPTILEHRISMHCPAIPSILDRFESTAASGEQNETQDASNTAKIAAANLHVLVRKSK
jgi:hypothetical protein